MGSRETLLHPHLKYQTTVEMIACNLTENITSASVSRDISMPVIYNVLMYPMFINSFFKYI